MNKSKTNIFLLFLPLFFLLFTVVFLSPLALADVPQNGGLNNRPNCNEFGVKCNVSDPGDWKGAIMSVINYFLTFLGLIAVIVIIYAGVRLLVSLGNEQAVKTATKTIMYAVIGLLIVFLAYAIVVWVANVPTNTNSGANLLGSSSMYSADLLGSSAQDNATIDFVQENKKIFDAMDREISQLSKPSDAKNVVNNYIPQFTNLYNRLPNIATAQTATEHFLDALRQYSNEPTSTSYNSVKRYYNDLQGVLAKLPRMKAVISVIKTSGPVPLVVMFDGSGSSDPTGNTIPAENYEWWYLDTSGNRVNLGHGPIVSETFKIPNTYVVHLRIKSPVVNGKPSVLDGEATISIKAQMPPAMIHLNINNVDVSDLDYYKVTLEEAQKGLVFDPSGSVPKDGFQFVQTYWHFGDAQNAIVIDGSPLSYIHAYQKLGWYPVTLRLTDNAKQSFTKKINIEVSASVAIINITPKTGTTDTFFTFSSTQSRVPGGYKSIQWSIMKKEGEKIKESHDSFFTYRFDQPGIYTIFLNILDFNNVPVQTSVDLKVNSKPPVVNLLIKQKDSGHPNVFVFDASNSYDPDLGESLTYKWFVNGLPVTLANANEMSSKGEYVFREKKTYRVTLQVSDTSGNISEKTQNVVVTSVIGIDLSLNPVVARVQQDVTITATSDGAIFYVYDYGDGTTEKTDKSIVKHRYSKSGTFSLKVTAYDASDNSNTATALVHIAEADQPFAVVGYTINGDMRSMEKGLCNGNDGIVVSRADRIVFDGSKSVDRDGSPKNLDYSWDFGDTVMSTKPTVSHTFTALTNTTCNKVVLTVIDRANGKVVSSDPLYFKVANDPPTMQDLILSAPPEPITPVTVTASVRGAQDRDGKIVEYKWYYYQEYGDENFGTRITNVPSTTFIIPTRGLGGDRVTYHFVVEIKDNDGAVVSSEDALGKTVELTVLNRPTEAPTLDITVNKTTVKAGEAVQLIATARDSKGNILPDAKISWDFNSDGKYEDTTSGSYVNHIFQQPGNYTVAAKVDYQGTTNNNQIDIYVNPRSDSSVTAAFLYTVVDKTVFFQNNSKGQNLKYAWDFDLAVDSDGDGNAQNDVDAQDANPKHTYPHVGNYQVKLSVTGDNGAKDDVTRKVEIPKTNPVKIDPTKSLQAILVTIPEVNPVDHKVHITKDNNKVTVYAGASVGSIKEYQIDKNIYDASDDITNKNDPSFHDGSTVMLVYVPTADPIAIKLTVVGNDNTQDSVVVPVVFDDISPNTNTNSVVQQVNEKKEVLKETVQQSTMLEDKKTAITTLLTQGDVDSLTKVKDLITSDGTLSVEEKTTLVGQIEDIITLKQSYVDVDSAAERIKSLLMDAEPLVRIQINRALITMRESYGYDSQKVQSAAGEIKQALVDSEKITPDVRQQVEHILDQITTSAIVVPLNGNANTGTGTILNTNINALMTNNNNNGAISPVSPGSTPLWLSIIFGFLKFMLWILVIFVLLAILLFGGFIVYKKITGQDELDFEEFILDMRGKIEELFTKAKKGDQSSPILPEGKASETTSSTSSAEPVSSSLAAESSPVVSTAQPQPPFSEQSPTPPAPEGPVPDWLHIGQDVSQEVSPGDQEPASGVSEQSKSVENIPPDNASSATTETSSLSSPDMTKEEQPVEMMEPIPPVLSDEPAVTATGTATEDQWSPLQNEPEEEQIPIPGTDEPVGSEQTLPSPTSSSDQQNIGSKGQNGKKKRYYRPPYRNKNKNNNAGMPPKPPSSPLPS